MEESAADGKGPGGYGFDLVQALVAVNAACHTDRGIHSGHKPADQIGFVAGVTVPQQIKAKDALAQAVLCLADHLIGGAFQHRGTAGHPAYKGHVLHAVGAAEIQNGIRIDGAHQQVTAAIGGHPGTAQPFLLGVGHHFQRGLFAASLHLGKQFTHGGQGKAFLFKAPVFGRCVAALGKEVRRVGDRTVLVGQHNNQTGGFQYRDPSNLRNSSVYGESSGFHYTVSVQARQLFVDRHVENRENQKINNKS